MTTILKCSIELSLYADFEMISTRGNSLLDVAATINLYKRSGRFLYLSGIHKDVEVKKKKEI